MESKLKCSIVKFKRGTFTVKDTGELKSYCQFFGLVLGPTTENETGYDYKKYKCKVENYNQLLKIIASNKQVEITLDLIEQYDGSYQPKVIAIDDYQLI